MVIQSNSKHNINLFQIGSADSNVLNKISKSVWREGMVCKKADRWITLFTILHPNVGDLAFFKVGVSTIFYLNFIRRDTRPSSSLIELTQNYLRC